MGCPCNISLEKQIKMMISKKINYKLCKIGSNLNVYEVYVKKIFDNLMETLSLTDSLNLDDQLTCLLIKDLSNTIFDVKVDDIKTQL